MLYSLYLSAAGLATEQHRQNVIANNLANAETTGFKRDLANVQSRPSPLQEYPALGAAVKDPTPGAGQMAGIFLARTTTDYSQGTLKPTGNATDLALNGPGFFALQGQGTQPVLTRDGRFLIDSQNRLVSATTGRAVLGTSGQPITVEGNSPIMVGPTGEIRQNNAVVGQLALYNPTPESLTKQGANTFTARALAAAPESTAVQQRTLETSNAEPLIELTQMLEGQRTFEANAKMIQYQDQMLAQLSTLGRVA